MAPELAAKILMVVAAGAIGWIFAGELNKVQWVRLLDVFVYGPFMLAVAFWPVLLSSSWAVGGMLFLGASTITFNGRNWLRAAG